MGLYLFGRVCRCESQPSDSCAWKYERSTYLGEKVVRENEYRSAMLASLNYVAGKISRISKVARALSRLKKEVRGRVRQQVGNSYAEREWDATNFMRRRTGRGCRSMARSAGKSGAVGRRKLWQSKLRENGNRLALFVDFLQTCASSYYFSFSLYSPTCRNASARVEWTATALFQSIL